MGWQNNDGERYAEGAEDERYVARYRQCCLDIELREDGLRNRERRAYEELDALELLHAESRRWVERYQSLTEGMPGEAASVAWMYEGLSADEQGLWRCHDRLDEQFAKESRRLEDERESVELGWRTHWRGREA